MFERTFDGKMISFIQLTVFLVVVFFVVQRQNADSPACTSCSTELGLTWQNCERHGQKTLSLVRHLGTRRGDIFWQLLAKQSPLTSKIVKTNKQITGQIMFGFAWWVRLGIFACERFGDVTQWKEHIFKYYVTILICSWWRITECKTDCVRKC